MFVMYPGLEKSKNIALWSWLYLIRPPSGGSLGWKTRGSLHGDFEKVAYELEPSTVNNPKVGEAKTGFGYVLTGSSTMLPARTLTRLSSKLSYHNG